MLTQVGCQNIVCDAIQRCATALTDERFCLDLESIISQPGADPDFEGALCSEACFILATIRNQSLLDHRSVSGEDGKTTISIDPAKLIRTGIPEDTRSRAISTRFFQIWTEVKAAIDKSHRDPEKLGAATVLISDEWTKKSVLGQLTAVGPPAFSHAGTATAESIANNLVTRALLEAMRFKSRSGKWPARIEELSGTWTDPFSGQP